MASTNKSISVSDKLQSADDKMSKDIKDLHKMIQDPSTLTLTTPTKPASLDKPAEKTDDRSYILALLKSVVPKATQSAQTGGIIDYQFGSC